MPQLKLGLFDIGLISPKKYSLETIEETLTLVRFAERYGYSRFWIGEHHGHDAAWRSPEIIIALMSANTSTIRVGSAGVLLNYHNALLCAQDYKLMANIFDGRIDLGFARGVVVDNEIERLLTEDIPLDSANFQRKALKVREILGPGPHAAILAPPSTDVFPEIWMLGTSLTNFSFARENNMNFCLSLCHRNFSAEELSNLAASVAEQCADGKYSAFKFTLMVNVLCAKTEKSARAITAEHYHSTLQVNFAGDSLQCKRYLVEQQDKFNLEEIIITDGCKDFKHRLKSISLLMKTVRN